MSSLLLFIILSTASAFAAPIPIIACGDLDVPGANYVLANDVISAGTCFTVKADNVLLDGRGYNITYATASDGFAINNSLGFNKLALSNLVIVNEGNFPGSYGFYSYNASDNNISNSNITTGCYSCHAAYFDSSPRSILTNNSIRTYGITADAVRIVSSNSSRIYNNSITTAGDGGIPGSSGIYIQNSNLSIFSNNSVLSEGINNTAIYVSSSGLNNISSGIFDSISGYDYYLESSGSTNRFKDTGFKNKRDIYFYNSESVFNYSDNATSGIWIDTQISASDFVLDRTITTWNKNLLVWNDSSSKVSAVTYTLNGLSSSIPYVVEITSSSGSTKTTKTTDSYGSISTTVAMDMSDTEIRVYLLTLTASLSPNPASGQFPLKNVDLAAAVSGTAIGNIDYKFDCESDGVWDLVVSASTNPNYVALNLCDYPAVGAYVAKVNVTRDGLTISTTSIVNVFDTIPPMITVQSPLSANYTINKIWFNLTLNEPGSWCGYSLDGAANVSMTNSSGNWNKYVTVPDGNHAVVYTCKDQSGNANKSLPVYFTVDITPPAVSVIHLPTVPSMSVVVFNVTCFDATSGCNYTKITAAPYSCTVNHLAGEKNCSITLTTECETESYGYSVISEDLVGNVNTFINGQFSVKKGDGCPCMTFDECMSGSCIGYELCAPSTPVNLNILPAGRKQINMPLGETETITLMIENPIGIADTVKFKIEGYPAEIGLWTYFDGQKYGSMSEKTVSIGPNSVLFLPLHIYAGKTGTYKLNIGAVSSATQQWAYNQTNIHISLLEKEGVHSDTPEITFFGVLASIMIAAFVLEMKHNKDQI